MLEVSLGTDIGVFEGVPTEKLNEQLSPRRKKSTRPGRMDTRKHEVSFATEATAHTSST